MNICNKTIEMIQYRDVWSCIFTFIDNKLDWLHVKLTCKLFNQWTYLIFDPSIKNNQVIKNACFYGHLEIVKLLLQDSRVDPSANNNYAIRWTSENGHLKIVKLLLKHPRVDP